MRLVLLLILLLPMSALAQTAAKPGAGEAGDGPATCVAPPPDCVLYNNPNHRNCGTRGGPGCRKPNGHCAGWADHVARDCRVPSRRATPKPVTPSE